jgi:peroxiredoxin
MRKSAIPLAIFEKATSNEGRTLLSYSQEGLILLVFLRHLGCIFCRESLRDLAKLYYFCKERGVRLVFVHMSGYEYAEEVMNEFGLGGVAHISDPSTRLYYDFGLLKGTFNQLFGLKVWIRGFKAGVVDGLGAGKKVGDEQQMPGVFLVHNGQVLDSFVHQSIADVPDYKKMIERHT